MSSEDNVIKVSASKPFTYRESAIEKLQASPSSTIVISGLSSAINTAVTVAELLKSSGICEIVSVSTSLFPVEGKAPKPKISVSIKAGPNFKEAVAAKQKEAEEKKQIQQTIDAGRERAHLKFKEMTSAVAK